MFIFGPSCVLAQLNTKKIDSLLSIAKVMTNIDSSNKLIEEVIQQSKKINYTNGVIGGVLSKGVNLFNVGRFEESLKLTHAWEQIVVASEDNAKISHLYALQGNSYGRLLFFEEAHQSLMRSLSYGQKIVDNNTRYYNLGRTYGIIANNIQKNTNITVNLDSVLYYRKKSYQIQQKITGKGSVKTGLVLQANAIAHVYLEKHKPDSAKQYLDVAMKLISSHQLEKYGVETLTGFGQLHFQQKHLDSALFYYEQALRLAMKTKNMIDIKKCYQKLAEIHEKMGNKADSYAYLKKYATLADSLAQTNKNAVKTSADIIVDQNEREYAHKKLYYTLIIIGSILLLITLSYVLVKFRKRHQKVLTVHKLKQEQLYQKLAFLSTKTLTDKVDEAILKEIVELAMANDPAFMIKFQEFHPVFIQRLMERAPSLVNTELLICAQLRLGFYTKEIARYTKASVRSIEGKKHRIRKKLDIATNEDINVWMMQL